MKGRGKKRKGVRRLIRWLIILILLGALGYYAVTSLKQEYTVTYDTYTAARGSISNALSLTGNLALIDSASYTASASGTVRKVYARAGEAVKDGDSLLRLSNGQTVKAEFDGTVNVLNVGEGDEVKAGDALVQVADMTHLAASLRVSEYDIADIAVGDKCTVTTTATGERFESVVDSINYISSSTGTVAYYTATVYVDVSGTAYPGMQITVSVPKDEANDVVVLKADALSFDEKNSAYVYMKDENGELKEVPVEVGVSNGSFVEIKSGLSEGDTVYVESAQEETAGGISGLFSGMFSSRRFNSERSGRFSRSGSSNNSSGGMPGGMPGGGMPGGMPGRGGM